MGNDKAGNLSEGANRLWESFGNPPVGSHIQTSRDYEDYEFHRELEEFGCLKRDDDSEGDDVIDYSLVMPHPKFK